MEKMNNVKEICFKCPNGFKCESCDKIYVKPFSKVVTLNTIHSCDFEDAKPFRAEIHTYYSKFLGKYIVEPKKTESVLE